MDSPRCVAFERLGLSAIGRPQRGNGVDEPQVRTYATLRIGRMLQRT
jgi:hypothetical protein